MREFDGGARRCFSDRTQTGKSREKTKECKKRALINSDLTIFKHGAEKREKDEGREGVHKEREDHYGGIR